MSCDVRLTGHIVVGGSGGCASPCSGAGAGATRILPLGGGCSGKIYARSGGTDCAVPIATSGAPGAAWETVPGTEGISVESLYLSLGSGVFKLRINGAAASLAATGGSYPTGFSGGETVDLLVDGTAVAVAFEAGDQSAQEVADRINQAAVVAVGRAVASVVDGQLVLSGAVLGSTGAVSVTTGLAQLGLATGASASGSGEELDVTRDVLLSFPADSPATRLEISGLGSASVFVAGS